MPSIKKLQIGSLNYDTIVMKNSSIYGKPGEPSLPAYPSYILLPKNTKIYEINVIAKGRTSLGSGYKIIPIEIKSGSTGSLKSLHQFHQDCQTFPSLELFLNL